MAYGPVECFAAEDPNWRWPFKPEVDPTGQVLGDMVDDGYVTTVAALVPTDWCGRVSGFNPTLPANEDWDLWRLAAAGRLPPRRRGGGPLPGRSRPPKTTGGRPPPPPGVLILQKLERSLGPEVARRLAVRTAIGRWCFGYGRSLLEAGDRWARLREMVRASKEDQRSWDYKLAWIVAVALLGGPGAGRPDPIGEGHGRRRPRKGPSYE